MTTDITPTEAMAAIRKAAAPFIELACDRCGGGMSDTKPCPKCGEPRFPGQGYCKSCRDAYTYKWRAANMDRWRELDRVRGNARYANDPEYREKAKQKARGRYKRKCLEAQP